MVCHHDRELKPGGCVRASSPHNIPRWVLITACIHDNEIKGWLDGNSEIPISLQDERDNIEFSEK